MFQEQSFDRVLLQINKNYQQELSSDFNSAQTLVRDDYASIIIAILQILYEKGFYNTIEYFIQDLDRLYEFDAKRLKQELALLLKFTEKSRTQFNFKENSTEEFSSMIQQFTETSLHQIFFQYFRNDFVMSLSWNSKGLQFLHKFFEVNITLYDQEEKLDLQNNEYQCEILVAKVGRMWYLLKNRDDSTSSQTQSNDISIQAQSNDKSNSSNRAVNTICNECHMQYDLTYKNTFCPHSFCQKCIIKFDQFQKSGSFYSTNIIKCCDKIIPLASAIDYFYKETIQKTSQQTKSPYQSLLKNQQCVKCLKEYKVDDLLENKFCHHKYCINCLKKMIPSRNSFFCLNSSCTSKIEYGLVRFFLEHRQNQEPQEIPNIKKELFQDSPKMKKREFQEPPKIPRESLIGTVKVNQLSQQVEPLVKKDLTKEIINLYTKKEKLEGVEKLETSETRLNDSIIISKNFNDKQERKSYEKASPERIKQINKILGYEEVQTPGIPEALITCQECGMRISLDQLYMNICGHGYCKKCIDYKNKLYGNYDVDKLMKCSSRGCYQQYSLKEVYKFFHNDDSCDVCKNKACLVNNLFCGHQYCLNCIEQLGILRTKCYVSDCDSTLSTIQIQKFYESEVDKTIELSVIREQSQKLICAECKNKTEVFYESELEYFKCSKCQLVNCVKHNQIIQQCFCFCKYCLRALDKKDDNTKICHHCLLIVCIHCREYQKYSKNNEGENKIEKHECEALQQKSSSEPSQITTYQEDLNDVQKYQNEFLNLTEIQKDEQNKNQLSTSFEENYIDHSNRESIHRESMSKTQNREPLKDQQIIEDKNNMSIICIDGCTQVCCCSEKFCAGCLGQSQFQQQSNQLCQLHKFCFSCITKQNEVSCIFCTGEIKRQPSTPKKAEKLIIQPPKKASFQNYQNIFDRLDSSSMFDNTQLLNQMNFEYPLKSQIVRQTPAPRSTTVQKQLNQSYDQTLRDLQQQNTYQPYYPPQRGPSNTTQRFFPQTEIRPRNAQNNLRYE